jgi:hypothetical protein
VGASGFELIQELIAAGTWEETEHVEVSQLKFQWRSEVIRTCVADCTCDVTEQADSQSLDGWKYVVKGGRERFYLVLRLRAEGDGRPYVEIITAHPDGEW